jgi:hypothetical protein
MNIFGAIVQNLIARAIRHQIFVHPCITIYCCWRYKDLEGNCGFRKSWEIIMPLMA